MRTEEGRRPLIVSVLLLPADKESANCRLEGNYVHSLGKPWVPLLLQEGYVPTCAPAAARAPFHGRANRSGWGFRVFQPQNLVRKRASLWH